jgi:hypothetical protein
MKFFKKFLGRSFSSRKHNTFTDVVGRRQGTFTDVVGTPIKKFLFIYFTPQFCKFYETHDYIHSILEKYNNILKNEPGTKLSDFIYDDIETFDSELEYFIDLAYFNDGQYLVDFIVHNYTKPLYDQAILFNLLFKRGYLETRINRVPGLPVDPETDEFTQQRINYYKIVSQFFDHLQLFGEIDPTKIKETRDENFID